MRSAAITEFGGPEQLQIMDVPTPRPAADQVLIRTVAAGVGMWDTFLRKGYFGPQPFPYIPGWEVAGVVESVGSDVTAYSEGESVYASCFPTGGYAEYVAIPVATVARKPNALTFAEAAGVPITGLTTHEVLTGALALKPGETLLITGAAGGVGTFAVQFATSLGARVIGTASVRNHDYLRALGASDVVDYTQGDWVAAVRERAPQGVDAVLDCVGGDTLARCFDAVRDGGRVEYIVASGPPPEPGRGITAHAFTMWGDGARLAELAGMFDAGTLRAHLDDVLPLEQAGAAHARIEGGHTRGKLVLAVDPARASER